MRTHGIDVVKILAMALAGAMLLTLLAIAENALAFSVTLGWDQYTDEDATVLTLYHNKQKVKEMTRDPQSHQFPTSVTLENVAAGAHVYWLTATDAAGNESYNSNAASQPLINWTITITQ